MNLKLNQGGMTLAEVLIVTAISGAAGLALVAGISQNFKNSKSISDTTDAYQGLFTAERFIRRVGRVATLCSKIPTGLECDVDRNTPATGVLTKIRFVTKNDSLVYQIWNTGTNRFEDSTTYSGINSLTICDTNDLAVKNGCSIPGQEGVLAKKSPRYFRYQLKTLNANRRELEAHSAFYVRNPTPFGANVVYQW